MHASFYFQRSRLSRAGELLVDHRAVRKEEISALESEVESAKTDMELRQKEPGGPRRRRMDAGVEVLRRFLKGCRLGLE